MIEEHLNIEKLLVVLEQGIGCLRSQ